jgi:50S ribosomal protein L16 3-hydroxylase
LRMGDPDRLGDWFGSFITTYRTAVEPAADEELRPRIEIEWDLSHGASLLRHPWSRMAWRRAAKDARLYAGGQMHGMGMRDARALAAADIIDGLTYERLGPRGREAVFALLEAGHYRLHQDEPE